MPVSTEKERVLEKPVRISKFKNNEKDIRSYSPSLRKELKPLSTSKDKQIKKNLEKDTENDDIKSLYKQLQDIKSFARLDSKENSSEKLKKIMEYANQALNNKLFSKLKIKKKSKEEIGE